MIQEIKPTYITFEQAKLLANKGYPQKECGQGYTLDGQDSFDYTIDWLNKKAIAKPEQHVVVEWLRINHGIWVQGPFPINNGKWEWVIFLLNEPLENTDGYKNIMSLHTKQRQFNSPQEAYSAAFDYVLNNLI
jgi:hypothetical protein